MVEISFTSAIARKNYYSTTLAHLIHMISANFSGVAKVYPKHLKEIDAYIVERLSREFGNPTNASADLSKSIKPILKPPKIEC